MYVFPSVGPKCLFAFLTHWKVISRTSFLKATFSATNFKTDWWGNLFRLKDRRGQHQLNGRGYSRLLWGEDDYYDHFRYSLTWDSLRKSTSSNVNMRVGLGFHWHTTFSAYCILEREPEYVITATRRVPLGRYNSIRYSLWPYYNVNSRAISFRAVFTTTYPLPCDVLTVLLAFTQERRRGGKKLLTGSADINNQI